MKACKMRNEEKNKVFEVIYAAILQQDFLPKKMTMKAFIGRFMCVGERGSCCDEHPKFESDKQLPYVGIARTGACCCTWLLS
uniref:Uncharacterized protein n=1 Tax=Romanomermis culicivorax TaxID=13658 RepID=A0A915JTM1_ROMCU